MLTAQQARLISIEAKINRGGLSLQLIISEQINQLSNCGVNKLVCRYNCFRDNARHTTEALISVGYKVEAVIKRSGRGALEPDEYEFTIEW